MQESFIKRWKSYLCAGVPWLHQLSCVEQMESCRNPTPLQMVPNRAAAAGGCGNALCFSGFLGLGRKPANLLLGVGDSVAGVQP